MAEFLRKIDRELLLRSGGGLGVGVGVLLALFAGGYIWLAMALVLALGSLWEYYGLLSERTHVSRGVGVAAVVALMVLAFRGNAFDSQLAVLALTAVVLACVEVIRRQLTGYSYATGNLGATIGGVVYLGLPWSFLVSLRAYPWGFLVLLTVFLCTWSCDVSAYFVGTRWGRRPLCSEVSPRKSIEGFWGGLCGSLMCAAGVAYLWGVPPIPLLLVGLLCATAGQLGDLAESVLKREAGVKDSGNVIPGHGGFLDRFDSILFNGTLVFLLFEVIWF